MPVKRKEKQKSTQLNLGIRNPLYLDALASRTKSRDLYEGTDRVREKSDGGKTYLIQETKEEKAYFDIRLKRMVVDPYVKKIVEARLTIIYNKPVNRKLGQLKKYEKNVDLKGTNASVFFHNVAKESSIDGLGWVLINKTPGFEPEEGVIISKADENALALRFYFQFYNADEVIDWEFDENGILLFVVIEQDVQLPRNIEGYGFQPVVEKNWLIWTQTSWIVYKYATEKEKDKKTGSKNYVIIDAGEHDLGLVPIVPFYGVKREEFFGDPVAKQVLDHVILLLNKTSDKDFFERRSAHPIPYTTGPEAPKEMDTGFGFHLTTTPENPHVSAAYMEPEGKAFETITESINDLSYKILSISLSQAKKDSAQVQSADGQKEDRKMFSSSLKTASIELQNSEKRCWDIAALWDVSGKNNTEILYNNDFDNRIIEYQMINALKDATTNKLLPIETFLQLLIDGEILPADFDIKTAIKAIQEDILRETVPGASVLDDHVTIEDEDVDLDEETEKETSEEE